MKPCILGNKTTNFNNDQLLPFNISTIIKLLLNFILIPHKKKKKLRK